MACAFHLSGALLRGLRGAPLWRAAAWPAWRGEVAVGGVVFCVSFAACAGCRCALRLPLGWPARSTFPARCCVACVAHLYGALPRGLRGAAELPAAHRCCVSPSRRVVVVAARYGALLDGLRVPPFRRAAAWPAWRTFMARCRVACVALLSCLRRTGVVCRLRGVWWWSLRATAHSWMACAFHLSGALLRGLRGAPLWRAAAWPAW